MRQGQFEPVLLSDCQTAPTCLPVTENAQRLSGCHLSSESPSELIRVTAQASNFSLRSTWPESFQPRPNTKQHTNNKANDTKRSLWLRQNTQVHLQC